MAKEQPIKLKDIILNVQNLFLDESIDLNFQKEKEQKLFGKIWEIISLLYPDSRLGQTTLFVPSERLVELGLVSEQTAEQIIQRKSRKDIYKGEVAAIDEPQNIVTITRNEKGYYITKTYVAEEQSVGEECLLRRDMIVMEELTLEKTGTEFELRMKVTEGQNHLHALDQTWFPVLKKRQLFEEKPITGRDLNRTLALLIEGLSPGYLKPIN